LRKRPITLLADADNQRRWHLIEGGTASSGGVISDIITKSGKSYNDALDGVKGLDASKPDKMLEIQLKVGQAMATLTAGGSIASTVVNTSKEMARNLGVR
jgi:hypothetical protein